MLASLWVVGVQTNYCLSNSFKPINVTFWYLPELTEKITIKESNLSEATKKDYDFRLGLFYRFSPIKSDDELIDCPTCEVSTLE